MMSTVCKTTTLESYISITSFFELLLLYRFSVTGYLAMFFVKYGRLLTLHVALLRFLHLCAIALERHQLVTNAVRYFAVSKTHA